MAQAIVDPQELRRFASTLRRFSAEMQNQLAVMHGQLNSLGGSWRDQEHQKFLQEFEQTMTAVKRFVDATNEHVPFLLRKADRAEEYLSQR
ncbi:WXG100 family type VII secretion target [bacterium]|jgi:WXG100 family type VII secretion target|nr:WXG100 family type VII secretion target [bacterium]